MRMIIHEKSNGEVKAKCDQQFVIILINGVVQYSVKKRKIIYKREFVMFAIQ